MKAAKTFASSVGSICFTMGVLFYTGNASAIGYEMMPSGMLQLDDGRVVGNDGYHMMPDGSLMLNDGTVLDNNPSSDHAQAPSHSSMTGNMKMNMSETPAAGTHVHHHHGAGSTMLEYSFMRMRMNELLDGSTAVSPVDATSSAYQYMMAPSLMIMDMHMLMMMYGLSDEVTFMSMFNYRSNQMQMLGGGIYTDMMSDGMGDTDVSLMYNINEMLIANIGVSIPTGSINERVTMTMGSGADAMTVSGNMPYSMQLGSGSYDLKPSITYNQTWEMLNWGGQGSYVYRMANNDNGYRLGNRMELDGWLKWLFNPHSNLGLHLNVAQWDKISGQDSKISQTFFMTSMSMNMKTSPLANPANYGGTRVNATLALSGKSSGGAFGFSFAVGKPIYQSLNGIQMPTDLIVSSSVNVMF